MGYAWRMLALGKDIPGYRILRELGRGGMAVVYLAIQESLGREVALKLLSAQLAAEPAAAERFLREGRIAAKLSHRNIVSVYDVGVYQGQPYLTMEYMPAGTVSTDAHAPGEALEIARQIALALDHAHTEGVIHRDLKPENILRRKDGSYALADFGIARTLDSTNTLTQEGTTVGTPHYMSPEQLQGQPLDGRSDIYSLGVLLFQLLTGRLPYRGTDGAPVGMQHVHAPIPSLPDGLGRYQALLDSLLAKSPNQRPATGADAAKRIEALQTSSHATIPNERVARRQRPTWVAPVVLVFVAIGLAGYFVMRLGAIGTATPAETASGFSVAVLPFENLSSEKDNDYFVAGMQDLILTRLADIPELKVVSRTSTAKYSSRPDNLRRVGQELGVTHVLEGSVQRAGKDVLINVQLIDARNDGHVWAQDYPRTLDNIFGVESEVAQKIADALKTKTLNFIGRAQLDLGHTDEVIKAIDQSDAPQAAAPRSRDTALLVDCTNAHVYADAGRADRATALLERVLATAHDSASAQNYCTPAMLWLDHAWDPIRGSASFRALQARYAANVPESVRNSVPADNDAARK
jgi:serine/threonine protein kinase